MPAKTRNLVIEQGVTWNDFFVWKAYNEHGILVPVDLTDYTGKMQIRPFLGSPDLIIEVIPVFGGTAGSITSLIIDEVTAVLDFSKALEDTIQYGRDENGQPVYYTGPTGVYDLWVERNSVSKRLTRGPVCFSKRVTNEP